MGPTLNCPCGIVRIILPSPAPPNRVFSQPPLSLSLSLSSFSFSSPHPVTGFQRSSRDYSCAEFFNPKASPLSFSLPLASPLSPSLFLHWIRALERETTRKGGERESKRGALGTGSMDPKRSFFFQAFLFTLVHGLAASTTFISGYSPIWELKKK